MRIWTIQPAELFTKLERERVLHANWKYANRNFCDAYRWMAVQLQRFSTSSQSQYFWWGWYWWQSATRSKPDLRFKGHLPQGQEGVRIEIEISDEQVLLSDFEAWNIVLMGEFVSGSEDEEKQFEEDIKQYDKKESNCGQRELRLKIVSSWQKIFDLRGGDPEWRLEPLERRIQAVFWELRYDDVVDVQNFVAR